MAIIVIEDMKEGEVILEEVAFQIGPVVIFRRNDSRDRNREDR